MLLGFIIYIAITSNDAEFLTTDKYCASGSGHVAVNGIYQYHTGSFDDRSVTSGPIFINLTPCLDDCGFVVKLYARQESNSYIYWIGSASPYNSASNTISYPNPFEFNPTHFFTNWRYYSGGWIDDTDLRIVNCNDICVTGITITDLNGIYEWQSFDRSLGGSVYFCQDCVSGAGSYLKPHLNSENVYQWRIDSSSHTAYCNMGNEPSASFPSQVTDCKTWSSLSGADVVEESSALIHRCDIAPTTTESTSTTTTNEPPPSSTALPSTSLELESPPSSTALPSTSSKLEPPPSSTALPSTSSKLESPPSSTALPSTSSATVTSTTTISTSTTSSSTTSSSTTSSVTSTISLPTTSFPTYTEAISTLSSLLRTSNEPSSYPLPSTQSAVNPPLVAHVNTILSPVDITHNAIASLDSATGNPVHQNILVKKLDILHMILMVSLLVICFAFIVFIRYHFAFRHKHEEGLRHKHEESVGNERTPSDMKRHHKHSSRASDFMSNDVNVMMNIMNPTAGNATQPIHNVELVMKGSARITRGQRAANVVPDVQENGEESHDVDFSRVISNDLWGTPGVPGLIPPTPPQQTTTILIPPTPPWQATNVFEPGGEIN